jgi:hypothetical protein
MSKLFAYFLVVLLLVFAKTSYALPNEGVGEFPQDIWGKYAIPVYLQKEEIEIFLRRMEWFIETSKSNDWHRATQHPARRGAHQDWNGVELMYEFETTEIGKNNLRGFGILQLRMGTSLIEDLRFEGVVGFASGGNPTSYQDPLWTIEFGTPEIENADWGISWIKSNTMGKKLVDVYKKHGENFWTEYEKMLDKYYYRELRETVLLADNTVQPIVIPENVQIHTHEIPNDKNMKDRFDLIQRRLHTLKGGNVQQLLDDPSVAMSLHWERQVLFRFEKSMLFDVAIVQETGKDEWIVTGEYVLFGKDGVQVWLCGDLQQDINAGMAHRPLELRYAINGDGIEVKFHLTGFPASYKTIVRNRLFGRQIEWDEEGKVLSDVDIDIPMPWADAPKPASEREEPVDFEPEETTPVADAPSQATSPPTVQPLPKKQGSILLPVLVTVAILAILGSGAFFVLKRRTVIAPP